MKKNKSESCIDAVIYLAQYIQSLTVSTQNQPENKNGTFHLHLALYLQGMVALVATCV